MKKCLILMSMVALSTSCAREQQQVVVAPSTIPGELSNGYRIGLGPVSVSTLKIASNFDGKDVSSLPQTKIQPSFKVLLKTLTGETLTQGSQVKPNTQYQLVINGENNIRYHIQQYDGFDLVASSKINLEDRNLQAIDNTYVIKSNSDANATLYMRIVPLFISGNVLHRGIAKTVTLVDYNE